MTRVRDGGPFASREEKPPPCATGSSVKLANWQSWWQGGGPLDRGLQQDVRALFGGELHGKHGFEHVQGQFSAGAVGPVVPDACRHVRDAEAAFDLAAVGQRDLPPLLFIGTPDLHNARKVFGSGTRRVPSVP